MIVEKEVFPHEVYIADTELLGGAFQFEDLMTGSNIRVLLDCLNDTYDLNKLMAYDLLATCHPSRLPFQVSCLRCCIALYYHIPYASVTLLWCIGQTVFRNKTLTSSIEQCVSFKVFNRLSV